MQQNYRTKSWRLEPFHIKQIWKEMEDEDKEIKKKLQKGEGESFKKINRETKKFEPSIII